MITTKTIRKLLLSMSGVDELPHFEKTSFRYKKKIILTIAEEEKNAVIKLTPHDQSVFCAFDKNVIYPVKGSWGKNGWTVVKLKQVPVLLFKDMLNVAYATVANVKREE